MRFCLTNNVGRRLNKKITLVLTFPHAQFEVLWLMMSFPIGRIGERSSWFHRAGVTSCGSCKEDLRMPNVPLPSAFMLWCAPQEGKEILKTGIRTKAAFGKNKFHKAWNSHCSIFQGCQCSYPLTANAWNQFRMKSFKTCQWLLINNVILGLCTGQILA